MANKREYALGVCMIKRLKLTRNLSGESFTAAMTTEDSKRIKAQISEQLKFMEIMTPFKLREVSLDNRWIQQVFYHEGLLMADPLRGNLEIGILRSEQEDLQISINDLDHLRMTLSSQNQSFDELWQRLDLLDDGIANRMELAYMEPFGYLTSKIEQLGTGLNGEAILHLPALKKTGFIGSLSESMGAIGVQIRPYKGDFYTVYNTVTLGRQEMEIALLLDQVVEKLAEREWAGRETLWASEGLKLRDQIGRSFGICQYGGQIEEEEGIDCLSHLILGDRYGVIQSEEGIEAATERWQKLLLQVSDVKIDADAGKNLSPRERHAKRSEILNQIHQYWYWRG